MELTANQLRQIILEEMQRLGETDEGMDAHGRPTIPQLPMAGGPDDDLEARVEALESAVQMLRSAIQQKREE